MVIFHCYVSSPEGIAFSDDGDDVRCRKASLERTSSISQHIPAYPSYSKPQSTRGLIHSHPMAQGARMPPVATVMNAMVQESLAMRSLWPRGVKLFWYQRTGLLRIPSGKRANITMENHHFHWVNPRTKSPCSIAMLNYQRVGSNHQPELIFHRVHQHFALKVFGHTPLHCDVIKTGNDIHRTCWKHGTVLSTNP